MRAFNGVAPPEARAGFENYLGTKIMDGATDGRGRLSGDSLALGTRNASDILNEVQGLRERIMGVRAADTAMSPQRAGPLGRMPEAPNTTAAGQSVLPGAGSPHLNVGGQGELADATRRIGAIDPEGIAQLVRQRMADQADTSMGRLVGGEAQGAGARFAKDIAGTAQQDANLRAVIGALPNSPQAPLGCGGTEPTARSVLGIPHFPPRLSPPGSGRGGLFLVQPPPQSRLHLVDRSRRASTVEIVSGRP